MQPQGRQVMGRWVPPKGRAHTRLRPGQGAPDTHLLPKVTVIRLPNPTCHEMHSLWDSVSVRALVDTLLGAPPLPSHSTASQGPFPRCQT